MKIIPYYVTPEKDGTIAPFGDLVYFIFQKACEEVFGDEEIKFNRFDDPAPDVVFFGGGANCVGIRALSPAMIATAPMAYSFVRDTLRIVRDGAHKPNVKIKYARTAEAVEAALEYFSQWHDPISADIEYRPDKSLLCLSATYGDGVVVFTEDVVTDPVLLKKIVIMLADHHTVRGWNWKSDSVVMRRHTGIKVPTGWDGNLAHHVLHPGAMGYHSLKDVARMLLGAPDWEPISPKKNELGEVDFGTIPREELYVYNAYDAYYTHILYDAIMEQFSDNNYRALEYEITAANMLNDVEYNKVKIDVDYVQTLEKSFKYEEQEALSKLPEGLNPASPKQVKDKFAEYGIKMDSTDKDHLDDLISDHEVGITVVSEEAIEFAKNLKDFRKANKYLSTYVTAYLKSHEDGFLTPTFNPAGTKSGRLSSKLPNAQNIPRSSIIRNIITAHDFDEVLIECDYAQAELRLQAILSNDEKMISLFQPDAGDYFDNMMPEVFPEDFKTVEDYLYVKEHDPDTAKDKRAKLKGVVYGLSFGRGAKAIAKALSEGEVIMTVRDAQKIIDNFLNSQPQFKKWREEIEAAAIDPSLDDVLVAWTGQYFEFEVPNKKNASSIKRSALSFLPQSNIAGLCTTAGVRVNERLKKEYPGAKLVMLIHDALYVTCRREDADAIGQIMKFEMEQIGREVYGETVIFSADPSYAYRWGDIH